MKLSEILAESKKLTAAQKKQVVAQVKKIQWGDVPMTNHDLNKLEDDAYDSQDPAVHLAIAAEIRKWRDAARAEYDTLSSDLRKVEEKTKSYLADENVDRENVMGGGTTEESVCFWPEMVRHAKSSAVMRADDADIDLSAELGYKI